MSFLQHIFGERKQRAPLEPLYRAIVAAGRDPLWFRNGQVPDTIDGRFDVIAALLALVLIRLERDGATARESSVLLTELFIADMEGSLRQIGIGDYVVGKHVGGMMGALGGRLAAFRIAAGEQEGFAAPVRRNVFRDAPPSEEAVAFVATRLERFFAEIESCETPEILAGALPQP